MAAGELNLTGLVVYESQKFDYLVSCVTFTLVSSMYGYLGFSIQVVITPWALEGVLEYLKQVYGNPPVFVYENGLSLSLSLSVIGNTGN